MQSTVVKAVEVFVTKSTVGNGAASSALTTLYDDGEVGEKAFVVTFVMLTSIVFAGCDSLTMIVDTTVSVEGRGVLARAVTVSVWSDV